MGLLVEGVWHDQWYDTKTSKGEFVRSEAQFRNWITADGSAGQTGDAGFQAEAGRYHLYVSLACPWAHRTLIVRELKGLTDMISVDVVDPLMLEQGWALSGDFAAATGDSLFGYSYLHQIYTRDQPDYTGRVTVPVLWDKKLNRIVSNESSEIIRMFNTAFDHLGAREGSFYPQALQTDIDSVNSWIYDKVNNGVYRAGFATSQEAYTKAVTSLFDSLDRIEAILSSNRYLIGEHFTEADIRLFTTLVRFDPVYVTHFKCDLRRISDYPAISGYLREIYQMEGIAETVNMEHIRHHYYRSHSMINPTGVISIGAEFDLTAAHGRDSL
ncbi:glutathione S-transferase family protein [Neptuniibacter caesariensis]|uniref:Putative transferase n=1 Tax=Neptuniibacter caesariensis TaxID=207954 RepID=A0A7U8C3V9_NEPCE|nr:glutathione S-transferase family protein [Neptuniibacter caesariensis]EAR61023.1 putative transferase [Neptuniibacter caesariensis]